MGEDTMLEPEVAKRLVASSGWRTAAALSQAISLKRIADVLEAASETKDHHGRPVKFMDVLAAIEMNVRG